MVDALMNAWNPAQPHLGHPRSHADDVADDRADELGFFWALGLAIPVSLGLWIVILWALL